MQPDMETELQSCCRSHLPAVPVRSGPVWISKLFSINLLLTLIAGGWVRSTHPYSVVALTKPSIETRWPRNPVIIILIINGVTFSHNHHTPALQDLLVRQGLVDWIHFDRIFCPEVQFDQKMAFERCVDITNWSTDRHSVHGQLGKLRRFGNEAFPRDSVDDVASSSYDESGTQPGHTERFLDTERERLRTSYKNILCRSNLQNDYSYHANDRSGL